MMTKATMHDGSELDIEIQGEGPFLLIPVNPTPVEGEPAEEMRKWGADPALGRSLIEGLRDIVTVVAFDYEGHVLAVPKPDTLTPSNISPDVLAVADAAGAGTFAYYGYSWLAVVGLQLAIRTDRLTALVMGGFPPLDGPYAGMLDVTAATYRMASEPGPTPPPSDKTSEAGDWSTVEFSMPEPQARQFLTLYESLEDFDDRRVLSQLDCPRLCFAGSEDEIVYDERWGNAHVDMAGPLKDNRNELEAAGWSVRLLDGQDHTQAMQPNNVIPVIRPWLTTVLTGVGDDSR
jgi:pimeloyl-ACP methyl ester carboxylesterase